MLNSRAFLPSFAEEIRRRGEEMENRCRNDLAMDSQYERDEIMTGQLAAR